jgi:hypothetical protein
VVHSYASYLQPCETFPTALTHILGKTVKESGSRNYGLFEAVYLNGERPSPESLLNHNL